MYRGSDIRIQLFIIFKGSKDNLSAMIISFDRSEVQPVPEKVEDNKKMNEEIITITEGGLFYILSI